MILIAILQYYVFKIILHYNYHIMIKVEDITNLKWTPVEANMQRWCIQYIRKLQDEHNEGLRIVEPHCLVGTKGSAVVEELSNALGT